MEEQEFKITHAPQAPRILLEVLSARATLVILGTTYLVFIFSFAFDVTTTLRNFSGGDTVLGLDSCELMGMTTADEAWTSSGEWGCNLELEDHSNLWIGRVNNISNVISIGLRYRANNVTELSVGNKSYSFQQIEPIDQNPLWENTYILFDVDLYACFQKNFCNKVGEEDSIWYPVLTKKHQQTMFSDIFNPDVRDVHFDIIGNTFQNQESLPTKSKVQSYLIFIHYNHTTTLSVTGDTRIQEDDLEDIPHIEQYSSGFYQFTTISRPSTTIGDMLRPILMSITVIVALWYSRTVYQRHPIISDWLRERKWILFYFGALLLFQNPVYCVICHLRNPDGFWIFLSYALDAFSQASFFFVWLLFSDGIRRKSYFYMFYFPKLFLCILIFLTNLGILVLQFPSVGLISDRSSSLAAVYNWSKDTKITLIFFSLSFFSLIILWSIWWLGSLYFTGSTLQRVPYMWTRYLQLSFRFFCLQATFVSLYYFLEYGVVIYLILRNSSPVQNQHLDNISDNINTLFRHQTLLVGKVIFLTVYSIILAFLFLPADQSDSFHTLASPYALTEKDRKKLVKLRKKVMSNQLALSNIAHTKAEVYCVALAQEMFQASYEVYYDTSKQMTPSGFGPANWERHGYTIIDDIYNEVYDTYCCIVRHEETKKVVVAFRGSCSTQHWHNNFDYSLKAVDIRSLSMPSVDDGDGLEVGHYIDLRIDGVEGSISDDDDDENGDRENSVDPMTRVTATLRGVVGATSGAVIGATHTMIDATSEFLTAAVAHTPGISSTVQTYVHSGFWNSYAAVREFVHIKLRETLSENPTQVIFTGHSLGGALATFATLDFMIHSLDRINKYLRHKKLTRRTHSLSFSRPPQAIRDIAVAMYNFGSPKVGNWVFAQLYDKYAPNSFRTVTDGDIVCGLPPMMNYFHIGTEVLIDPLGGGSIIIDPSFVERRLRTRVSTSISVHAMSVYQIGLDGVLHISKKYANDFKDEVEFELDTPHPQSPPFLRREKSFELLSQESSHQQSFDHQLDISNSDSKVNSIVQDSKESIANSTIWSQIVDLVTYYRGYRQASENDVKEILFSRVPRRGEEFPLFSTE